MAATTAGESSQGEEEARRLFENSTDSLLLSFSPCFPLSFARDQDRAH
jgi:hypothetical protein